MINCEFCFGKYLGLFFHDHYFLGSALFVLVLIYIISFFFFFGKNWEVGSYIFIGSVKDGEELYILDFRFIIYYFEHLLIFEQPKFYNSFWGICVP